MNTDEFDFSQMVCFSLYASSNAMIREYRPQLEEFDLTYPQFLVMMSLWNKSAVNIKELSEQTYLDAGTLTQILKRLENKGFIERNKSSIDERAKVIELTEPGRDLKNKTSQILNKMACRINLTPQEKKEVTAICNKILSRLNE
ncbi:MarR family winged helix-turn-helix transcriptional regulator [Methylophaga sp.]|uniref:MarR family winged helix-turn-helix transcriptional regulator n=1 Tax=Methylophaga sp. TaxID=2024840 RepID=UPI002728B2CB|nr:MarR family transcriptional regulator [Methylophaga sp.]MDO8825811.1 MarR family transcriptional regulator [Methylophaga sp.]